MRVGAYTGLAAAVGACLLGGGLVLLGRHLMEINGPMRKMVVRREDLVAASVFYSGLCLCPVVGLVAAVIAAAFGLAAWLQPKATEEAATQAQEMPQSGANHTHP